MVFYIVKLIIVMTCLNTEKGTEQLQITNTAKVAWRVKLIYAKPSYWVRYYSYLNKILIYNMKKKERTGIAQRATTPRSGHWVCGQWHTFHYVCLPSWTIVMGGANRWATRRLFIFHRTYRRDKQYCNIRGHNQCYLLSLIKTSRRPCQIILYAYILCFNA